MPRYFVEATFHDGSSDLKVIEDSGILLATDTALNEWLDAGKDQPRKLKATECKEVKQHS